MSRHRVIAFVEGKEVDPFFYDRLLDATLTGTDTYAVMPIDSVMGGGGKSQQIELYEFMRDHRKLNQLNNHGRVSALFCLDRDFDDARGIMFRSKNVMYTRTYNVETEVFCNASSVEGLARVAALPESDAIDFHVSNPDWLDDLAHLWREWVELCLFSVLTYAKCDIKPSRLPSINIPSFGPPDPTRVAAARAEIRATATRGDVTQLEKDAERHCSRHERKYGSVVRMLNGKHISKYLHHLVLQTPCTAWCSTKALPLAVLFYLSTLNFDDDWTGPYQTHIQRLVA